MRSAYYLLISAVLSLIILYDLFSSLRRDSRLKEVRYVLHSITSPMSYAAIVLVLCVMVFNLYVYSITRDISMFFIAYWMLLLLVQSITNIARKGGIGEAGIGFSGRFYPWEDIKEYYCDKNTGRLGLVVIKNQFGYKRGNRLRLQAPKDQIEAIEQLLSERLK